MMLSWGSTLINGAIMLTKSKTNAKGETYWTKGHNAQPIKEGQCCDWCNANVVLPKRFENIQKGNFYVEKNT